MASINLNLGQQNLKNVALKKPQNDLNIELKQGVKAEPTLVKKESPEAVESAVWLNRTRINEGVVHIGDVLIENGKYYRCVSDKKGQYKWEKMKANDFNSSSFDPNRGDARLNLDVPKI